MILKFEVQECSVLYPHIHIRPRYQRSRLLGKLLPKWTVKKRVSFIHMTPKGCKSCEMINSWGDWNCPVDLVECWNWGRWDPAHLVFRQTKSWTNKTVYPETSLHGETSLHTDFLFCRFSRWTWVMTCIHRVWTELGWIQRNNSDVECGMVMSLHVPGPRMVTSIQGRSLRNQQTVVFVHFSRLRWTGWFLPTKLQVPQLEIEELHVWRVEPMFRCGEPASLRSPVFFRNLWGCQFFFDPDPGSNWNLASL